MEKTKYGFGVNLDLRFEEAVEKTVNALKEQGFGVLTEIDVKDTLKQKLDVDFKKYTILGACNPPLAHQALLNEEEIGLLLPCNVIVYEAGADSSRVVAVDPEKAMAIVDNIRLKSIAGEVKNKLVEALSSLKRAEPVKK
jgi:uncharacterized protein (DUF302 family)